MHLRDKATDKNVKAKPLKSTTSCDKTPVQFSGTQVQNSATHAKSEPFDMEHGTYKHIESIIYIESITSLASCFTCPGIIGHKVD